MKLNQILTASILASTIALPVAAQSPDPFCIGLYELRYDRYGEAVNTFSRVIRSNPRLSEAYYYRGVAHYQKKAYSEALANYNQALGLGLDKPRVALLNRAATLGQMGDYGQAIEDLRLILQITPDDAYAYRAMIYSYLKMGNRKAAIATLEKLAARYYRERRGGIYLRTRDDIKKIRAGGAYEFYWVTHSSSEYGQRCYR